VVCDPDDAAVLACALATAADLVISGDAYLLTLK
jgi:predicted nucleic acid-binding protein